MMKLRVIQFTLVLSCTSLPLAHGGQRASLEQILRPVDIPHAADVIGKALNPPPVRKIQIQLSDVLERLQQDLSRDLPRGDQIELSSTATWPPVAIAEDALWSVEVDGDFRPDNRGHWFPLVSLRINGEAAGNWRLPVRVALYREVWIAHHRLQRGEVPQEPSIQPVVRNIYLERGAPIPASEDLSGYELVNPVGEGRLLSWSDVTLRPLVRRGETVDVILNDGLLSVSMPAQSLQDGVKGDRITLRNPRSRREFHAVIIGPNRASVLP